VSGDRSDAAALGALGPIVARKAVEAEALRCAAAGMWGKAESLAAAPDVGVLRGGTVIAEMKRRSPSGGALREDLDCAATARGYAAAGAAAVSVLTDGPDFGGTLEDLNAVRAALSEPPAGRGDSSVATTASVAQLPLLRKDFIVEPVQVAESRVAGADWVLLIAAVLDGEVLDECLEAVARCRAQAIVEVHEQSEVERATAAGATCIGINNRDLRTLRTSLDTFARLRRHIPDGVVVVAESGVREPSDVRRLVSEGADSVLVGEALMRAADPGALCAEFVSAARAATMPP
jgi:indole-3-glycerol phosphate synthase